MARHALRLARLDPYVRSGHVETDPEKVEPLDLADLLELLRLVPWKDLGSDTTIWLNPAFGLHSSRVGGADCDLISGDRLIDLKATVRPSTTTDLRQVLGYLLLARAARATDASFPAIHRFGVYYARHRELVLVPVAQLRGPRSLEAVQERFFRRAEALSGGQGRKGDR